MKKHLRERQEANEAFNKPTGAELDKLRAEMGKKKQDRMNGRLQPRFFQVMFDWDMLRLLDDGRVSVRNALEFTKWNRANAMIEAADAKEQESVFRAYPEEKAAWDEKMAVWFRETREAIRAIGKQMKV